VDEDPGGKSLDEYQLAFGPQIEGDGLTVHQFKESGWIDEEAVLVVLEEGDAVQVADGNLHQAVRCQLCSEERLDEDLLEDYQIIEVPEKFTGVNIPEVDRLDDNQMAPFNLSINMTRAAEGDGGLEEKQESSSIWTKLGKLSKRLF